MKMPVTSITIFTPSGKSISAQPHYGQKAVSIEGLEAGPMLLRSPEEVFAVIQLLTTIYEYKEG